MDRYRFALIEHLIRFRLAGNDLPAALPFGGSSMTQVSKKGVVHFASSHLSISVRLAKYPNLRGSEVFTSFLHKLAVL